MEEIWKDIKGYEGYQASNLGRIRTHNKITYSKKHGIRHWKDKILHLKPTTTNGKSQQGTGYRVDLWKNGKPHSLLVARLVATTFLENLIDTNMTVNHKNGNRLDNRVENLEWLSRADNIKYGFENGQYSAVKKNYIGEQIGKFIVIDQKTEKYVQENGKRQYTTRLLCKCIKCGKEHWYCQHNIKKAKCSKNCY